MIHITKPDVQWLLKLLDIIEYIHSEYPELFSAEDEETLAIAGELIRGLNK
jgi:hypothetical protein